ncbi:alpha-glucosidase family protein [Alphaproteobacteria bacterium]|nr:alpha-glucosidase family protein [Alphaproteobacteria bacterium]
MNNHSKQHRSLWRGAVFYQIYPRSFHDTNADGIGDLKGITEKLSYIKDLGVDGIWICPFYPSPMKDFGYDVSDYRDIDPMFGNLDDFDHLLTKAHDLSLKIIIDLVLSHTSDQHPWFHDPAKKDWYVWADPKDGEPPNNWRSIFGGSAWTLDERYGEYYLHNFLKEQPDLNFHNPQVQTEALDIAKFWLERGVDGFRLDTVNFYFHDQQLRDNPPAQNPQPATQFDGDDPYSHQQHIHDKSQPENIEFLKKFRKLLDQYDAFAIGEIGDDNPIERTAEYTAPGLLHTAYNLQMMTGQTTKLTPALIRKPIEQFLKHKNCWPSWAFSNHDVVRATTRWNTPPQMLNTLLTCLYGTIFLYQGEELGLPETQLKFEDLQDPWGKHLWPQWQGRDGCRTPIPWTNQKPENTWLPVPDEHLTLNVEAQIADARSTLNHTKELLKNRSDILKYGDIKFINNDNPNILHFKRTLNGETIDCRFNLASPFDYRLSHHPQE